MSIREVQKTGIGVSGLFVRTGKVGGAEYMMYNLLIGMSECLAGSPATLFVNRVTDLDPAFLVRLARWNDEGCGFSLVEVDGAGNRFVKEAIGVPAAADKARVSAMLFPNYYTPPGRRHFKAVTVIHDLQYRHFPDYFTTQKRLWLNVAHRTTLRYADHVVVISDFVREDVLRVYGERHSDKLRTIPNPISWTRFDTRRELRGSELGVEPPYFLSVASHYPHKNLDTLLRAFAKARRKLPDYRLVLVGQWQDRLRGVKAGGGSELTELARELGLEGVVVMTGHVPDDKLGQLYRHAEVFVLPSRFEGFGMPAVEALGMGLPTVTTRCGSLPEATRELAVYLLDPLDVHELAEKLVEVALQPDAYRPSPEDAHSLREFYAPRRIAGEYLSLLTG